MARGKPGIFSIGNRHEWPREFWGSKDWEDEERLQSNPAEALETWGVIPPPGPQVSPSFSLFPRKRPARDARGRGVDKLLDELGIEPRGRGR
jgi:hypothetical protein